MMIAGGYMGRYVLMSKYPGTLNSAKEFLIQSAFTSCTLSLSLSILLF